MKVKFLDALYAGMPVVTTSIGAEGIDLKHDEHALICDDSDEFSTSVLELLSNSEKWKTMSKASRALANQKYTWQTHLKEIEKELNSIF